MIYYFLILSKQIIIPFVTTAGISRTISLPAPSKSSVLFIT